MMVCHQLASSESHIVVWWPLSLFFLLSFLPSFSALFGRARSDTQMYSEEPEIMQHCWLLKRSEEWADLPTNVNFI